MGHAKDVCHVLPFAAVPIEHAGGKRNKIEDQCSESDYRSNDTIKVSNVPGHRLQVTVTDRRWQAASYRLRASDCH